MSHPASIQPARTPAGSSAGRLSAATDAEIVHMVCTDAPAAFDEITRRYRRRLCAYCAGIVGPAEAEDAVQHALMRAFVSLRDGGEREINLRPWLYRIARNCSIDLLRSRQAGHEQLDPEHDGVRQPPAITEQKEAIGILVAAIAHLPESQRRALVLRELEGRSYGEICDTLGQTGAGVRQLIFRARTALRNGLGGIPLLGWLRGRAAAQPPAGPDPHQAGAAAGGGGLEAVGAVAAAALTIVSGMPAGDAGRGHDRSPAGPRAAALVQAQARPAADQAPRSAPSHATDAAGGPPPAGSPEGGLRHAAGSGGSALPAVGAVAGLIGAPEVGSGASQAPRGDPPATPSPGLARQPDAVGTPAPAPDPEPGSAPAAAAPEPARPTSAAGASEPTTALATADPSSSKPAGEPS